MSTKGLPRPKNISEYITAAPAEAQDKLYDLLACIRKAAPGATESLKWGKAAFSYDRILVVFAWYKNHIGFYPMSGWFLSAFKKELKDYKTSKGAVQFPLSSPLPKALIKKLIKERTKQIS